MLSREYQEKLKKNFDAQLEFLHKEHQAIRRSIDSISEFLGLLGTKSHSNKEILATIGERNLINEWFEIFADRLFFKLETCDNNIYLKKVNAFVDKLNANDGANASEAIKFFDWEGIFQIADAVLLKQEFKMLIEYKNGCLADTDENVMKMTAMAEEIAVIKKQLESVLKIQDDKLASDKPSASLTMFAKK